MQTWFPYIQPTNGVHDSGFGMFEVGYINMKTKEKKVLGACSDHICFWSIRTIDEKMGKDDIKMLNIDLLLTGEVRIFSQVQPIRWRYDYSGAAVSSMIIEVGVPSVERSSEEIAQEIEGKLGDAIIMSKGVKSNCCMSEVKVVGNTTKHYVCMVCGKACDTATEL